MTSVERLFGSNFDDIIQADDDMQIHGLDGEDILDLFAWGITSFDQLAFSSSGKGARIFREFGNERLRLGRFTEDGISLFESGDFVFAEPVSLADATMLPPFQTQN